MAFFQGSLQEGIATALQQSKSVVCFVTDGETESKLWEDDFFAEEEIRSLLPPRAVSLRLPAGSQEESFLAQLYPIPKKPTVVIIRNGELKEYIASGTSKDEFVRRMRAALTAPQPPAAQPAASQAEASSASTAAPPQPSHADESSASSSGQATPPTPTGSRIQSLLAERAARLAEKKKADEEEAKRQRAEKAKAKADAEASGRKKPDDQSKHAAALRKKQQEAREERQRILKAIEDDKAARRAQKADAEAGRKAAAAAAAAAAAVSSEEKTESLPFAPASQRLPSSGAKLSGHCFLQVRLFDGSTIRSRFASDETLADVRKWVDDNNTPKDSSEKNYVFKVLLTPQPSKTIDVADEGRSLEELGLVPTSTLILLRAPKRRAASAAAAGHVAEADWQGNAFSRFLAYVVFLVAGFFGTVVRFFSTLFSLSGPPAAPESMAGEESSSARTSQSQAGAAADAARRRGGRIAGLGQTDERRNDQQFYNGNSTNFEPRADDGE